MINFSSLIIKMFCVFAIHSNSPHCITAQKLSRSKFLHLNVVLFFLHFSSASTMLVYTLAKIKPEVITICWTLSIITPKQIYLPCISLSLFLSLHIFSEWKYFFNLCGTEHFSLIFAGFAGISIEKLWVWRFLTIFYSFF